MNRRIRSVLAAALATLAGTASAQAPAIDREAAERRAELVQTRRMVDAIRAIRREYVDELEEGPLAERCADGLRGWLADRSMGLEPSESPPVLPIDRIGDLMRRVGRQYSGIEFQKMADACLKPMIEGLDKHSGYLAREEFRELQVGTAGGMGGMGLEYKREGDYTLIVSTIENTPASRVDLKAGDLIVAIDGVSTKGLPLAEVVKLSRGKPGSVAVLDITRPGAGGTLRREVGREIIRIDTVRPRLLEDRLLYVRISQFQGNTYERVLAALRAESAKFPEGIAGIILDLRNNSGGLLNACVGVAAVFLPEKAVVVELRGRTKMNQRKLLARPEDYNWTPRDVMLAKLPEPLRNAPLALLVNRQTAACPEIIAGAMQDHRRGKVVGERTFGHGTVQTIVPLGDGAMKLTTSRYYRPGGAPIEANPIVPDIAVAHGERMTDYAGPTDPALPVARKLLLGR